MRCGRTLESDFGAWRQDYNEARLHSNVGASRRPGSPSCIANALAMQRCSSILIHNHANQLALQPGLSLYDWYTGKGRAALREDKTMGQR